MNDKPHQCNNKDCTIPVKDQRFNKLSRSSNGLAYKCKVCAAIERKTYNSAQVNKDKRKTLEARSKQQAYNNSTSVKAKRAGNPYAARSKAYYLSTAGKAVTSRYNKSEKGKIANLNKYGKRRAKKLSTSDGSVTSKYLRELKGIQGNRCFHCGMTLSPIKGEIHLDHYIPLSKGGAHSISNVVWSCACCNIHKRDTVPSSPLVFPVVHMIEASNEASTCNEVH